MNSPLVTIAAFSHTEDPGLQALSQSLKQAGIPYWLEELEAESKDEVWANVLPYRLRTASIDGPGAYSVWLGLLDQNDPYTELSEEDLEKLALAAADDEFNVPAEDVIQEEVITQTTWNRILEGPDIQPHEREGLVCPIDPELVEWIDEKLHWISVNLFNPLEKPTIMPEDYADWEYMADLEDAEFVFSRTLALMGMPVENNVSLYFMQSESVSGQYHTDSIQHYIGIDLRTLWNPAWLIDVMVHELCHYQLIGQRQEMPEDDELLTDLLAVAYGFGLLKGNEAFINEHGGGIQGNWSYLQWRVGRRGYLPRAMIAFAMALIEYRRSGGLPDWYEEIKPEWRADFKQSMKYIEYFSDHFKLKHPGSMK